MTITDNTGLSGTDEATRLYLCGLKVGEEVIEVARSCMFGKRGVVYVSKDSGGLCARWDLGDGTYMGTSLTGGTRRVTDVTIGT